MALLTRWRAAWSGSLRARLVALGLVPMVLVFPAVVAALIVLGGATVDRLLEANAQSKVDGLRNYLAQVRAQSVEHLKQAVTNERLQSLVAEQVAAVRPSPALPASLAARAAIAQLDFLVVADNEGRVIAASTGTAPGTPLPATTVVRQALAGVAASAVERLEAADLERLSPALASRARIPIAAEGGAAAVEARGLVIQAAVHFPLSNRYPDAILVGGILLNANTALIDHVREIVFPVTPGLDSVAGVASLYLDDVRVATTLQGADGSRALGGRAAAPVAREVGAGSGRLTQRLRLADAWHFADYETLADGEGRRIGMIAASFPEAPLVREKWYVLGSIAALLALAMLALTAANLWSARHLADRIGRIASAMNAASRGERAMRAARAGERDEIGRLAGHFDALVDALAAQEAAQREAQRQVAAEAARRRALFDNVRDGIAVVREDGSVFEVNPQFAAMLGYAPGEMAGMHIRDWEARLAPGDLEALPNLVGPAGVTLQSLHRRKDGSTFPVEVSASRIEWGGQTYILGIHQDITERLALQAEIAAHRDHLEQLVEARTVELAAARDEAEGASRAKSAFLTNMSHEMRTPLNAIIGLAQLMAAQLPDERLRGRAAQIGNAGRELLAMVEAVHDMTRLEADTLAIVPADFALAELLDGVEEAVREKARAKGIVLAREVDPGLPAALHGDRARLAQVLGHLLDNAVKFSERGRVCTRVRVAEARGRLMQVRFEVEDQGAGLTPEQQAAAFRLFEQGDSSTTRRHGGTGLGLALSKRLVALMGGEIGVTSTPGAGSTFWFSLRLGPGAAQSAAD